MVETASDGSYPAPSAGRNEDQVTRTTPLLAAGLGGLLITSTLAASAAPAAATNSSPAGQPRTRPAGADQAPGLAATAAATLPPDGTFVTYQGSYFRMAGRATLYVSSWAPFGGSHPAVSLSSTQWLASNQFPADGTFVQTAQDHAVYVFVAGAPIYVSTFAAFKPRPTTVITVDKAVIDKAGGPYPYDSVSASTLDWDGTGGGPPVFVAGGQTGRVYKLTGGAPTYVSNWANFGGRQATVVLDQTSIGRAGSSGVWRFLRRFPMDGWMVQATPGREVGTTPARIDTAVLAHSDSTAAPYGNLRYRPADGTFLRAVQSDRIYRVQGGVAGYVSSWTPYGGPQPYVDMDELAITRAGSGGPWNHLAAASR
jgi:hypothetical protein